MRIVFGDGPIKGEKCGKKDQGETGSVRKLRLFMCIFNLFRFLH